MGQKPKITQEEKQLIIAEFQTGDYSKYKIANIHGISWQMVHYIINPEKVAENRNNTVKNNVKNVLRVQKCLAKKKRLQDGIQ